MTPPPRLEGVVELLDRTGHSDGDIRGALRDLERLNRWFGGVGSVLRPLRRLAGGAGPGPLTILDIATGGADIPRAICRWARARGRAVQIEAVDRSAQGLAAAADWCAGFPEIRLRRAEVPPLPYPDRSFDVVVTSLFLHHLTADHAVALLREMGRVARRGVIVSDLRRGRAAHRSIVLGTRLFAGNPLTRHDGPLSIRRSFRPEELRGMAAAAGLANARMSRRLWFRIVLTAGSRGAA